MSEELLRAFIRETASASQGGTSQSRSGIMRGQGDSFYPFNSDTTDISIIRDVENDVYVAYVTTDEGEEMKSFPSEVEAQHWAKGVGDRSKRDSFAKQR